MLTAMVVEFCGRIWVFGFLVPLVVRRMTGPDMRKLLPAAMTFGALLMTLIFDLACMLGLESYMSVITRTFGGAIMIFTVIRNVGARNHARKGAAAPGMGFR